MFDLISRLREPLSAEGRAGFSQVCTCLVLSGLFGVSLSFHSFQLRLL